MKIGILTWYKAINHGAVLQAYASCQVLKKLECEPVILDFDWSINEKQKEQRWERLKRRIKKFSPMHLLWYVNVKNNFQKKSIEFKKFINTELPVGKKYFEESNLDAVYIGSDMVFDISEGYNLYMYGVGAPSNYVFSYAASFGYTTYEKLVESPYYQEIVDGLSKLKSIGYRDNNTLDICKKLDIQTEMCENIDPVLLYGFEKESSSWDAGKWADEDYILIYAYDSTMNDTNTVKQIKAIANEEKLKIVSCGYYHKWCDISVPASPYEFLEMFKHAQYVITDTFHGTVFSLILQKNFASIIRRNSFKLKYLLDSVRLGERITENNIKAVLSEKPDYTTFDAWIIEQRNNSAEFIRKNIEAAQ